MPAKQLGKPDLVEAFRAKFGTTTPQSEAMVAWLFDAMADQIVSGGSVVIKGFGAFHPKHVPSRRSFNIRARRVIETAPKVTLHFAPGLTIMERLKGGGS